MKTLLKSIFTFILILTTTQSFSQLNLANSTPVVENFNSLSNLTTNALSTSWRIQRSSSPTFTGGTRDLTTIASTGSPSTGGTYNWGNSTTSTDRCPGSMSSSSAIGPFSLMGWFRNTHTLNITSLTISYTLERYRINSTAASIQFFYSTNGTTWTSLTVGDISSSSLVAGSNNYSFNPTGNPSSTNAGVIQKSAFNLTGINIPQNSSIYLRWQMTVGNSGGSNSQGIGIDDINVTATYPTSTLLGSASASSFTTTYGSPSTSQSFPISGSNLTANIIATAPTGFEVSNDGITWGNTTTFSQSSGNASGTLRVRLSATALVTGSYNSRSIIISSTGAASINITTSSSGNQVNSKGLTINGINFQDKVYDGTTTVTMNGTPTYMGLVNGETFSVGGSVTWDFASPNAGNAISINRTGNYTTPSTNYNLTQPSGFTANITKANQTITFDNLPYKSTYDLDFSPVASSSSGLPLTIISSNPSVSTIIGDKIHITGIGTTTITVSQSGNQNYNPATSVSKDLMVDDPVSRWSFETITFSGTGQTPTVTNSQADLGEQTTNTSITGFHNSASTVWSSLVGNGSSKSIASTHWTVGDYFQFQVNTQYTTIIKLTFDQTSSSTGPKNFKLQWSTNGINFTDISNYSVPFDNTNNTAYTWSSTSNRSESSISFDLTGITEINDQPTVYFRVTNTSTTALLGGTIQTAGTSRIDNFTMFGNLDIPLPLNIISFKGKTSGSQNRLEWTLSDWGTVTIQKYVNGVWEVVGHTDNNVWFDTKPYKGISYYRIVSNNTISRPIYIVNEMGFELSVSEFKYYDFGGRNLDKLEKNKVLIKRNEFECEKILILE